MNRNLALILIALFPSAFPLPALLANDFDEYPTNPVMLDRSHGWWLKKTGDHFQILQTQDGGVHWQMKSASPSDQIISQTFLNEHEGYLLAASDPACGIQHKTIYHTSDGGKNWQVMASPPQEGLSYYATGIVFRSPKDGWITATYHGPPDAPIYRTTDGAVTWKLQQIEIPPGYQGGYADVFPPVFIAPDRKRGYLPVKLVRHEPKPGHIAWVNYESDDGGSTWHLPASGVQSGSDH